MIYCCWAKDSSAAISAISASTFPLLLQQPSNKLCTTRRRRRRNDFESSESFDSREVWLLMWVQSPSSWPSFAARFNGKRRTIDALTKVYTHTHPCDSSSKKRFRLCVVHHISLISYVPVNNYTKETIWGKKKIKLRRRAIWNNDELRGSSKSIWGYYYQMICQVWLFTCLQQQWCAVLCCVCGSLESSYRGDERNGVDPASGPHLRAF